MPPARLRPTSNRRRIGALVQGDRGGRARSVEGDQGLIHRSCRFESENVAVVTPSREQLEAAHCWEAEDEVRRDPGMTDFRRSTRYHQALWREAHGHPI